MIKAFKLDIDCGLDSYHWEWQWSGDVLKPIVATVIRCNYKTSKNKCGSILCKCRKNGLKCMLTCRDCRGMACTNMAEERNIEPKNDVEDYGNVFEKLFKF